MKKSQLNLKELNAVAEPVAAYDKLPPIVVDRSLLAAILFNEPSQRNALKVLSGKSLHAPNLMDHEIISVAAKKVRSQSRRCCYQRIR